MITVYSQRKVIGTDRYDYDLKGLSTDEKPSEIYGIEIVENSIFFEVDTGDFYYLKSQATSSTPAVWEKIGSGGSEPEPTYEKIYELTFSDWQDDGDGSYFTDINGSDAPSEMFPNTVTVDWDGVRYKDLEIVGGYQWGAPYDYELEAYDFSVYPFSFQLYDDVGGGLELHLVTNSDAEHTFEVYVEVDG